VGVIFRRIRSGCFIMPVDIERYTHHLRTKARPRSIARCAMYVREALEAGGAHTKGTHPIDAKNWGPTLL